jgi:Tfp pilus assembly protein PilN
MELGLLPANVVRRQELERRRPFFIAAAACLIAALLGWSAYYSRAAQITRDTAEVIKQKNASMRGAETQLDKLKKQIASLDSVATPLIGAINDRDFWPQILEELNARLPEADIWITELGATSGGKLLKTDEKRGVTPVPTAPTSGPGTKSAAAGGTSIDGILIRGLYLYNPKQQEVVVDYLHNLASSPFFVIDPKTPERVIKSNSVPNDTEWAFPYELQLTLSKPVKLP